MTPQPHGGGRLAWVLGAALLLAGTAAGLVVRAAPLQDHGWGFVGDLDPHRYARGMDHLRETEGFGGVDPLSAPPTGTEATYANTQGYYFLGAAISELAGVATPQAMAVTPLVFFALLCLSLAAGIYAVSRDPLWAGAAAALYAAAPRAWGLIPFLGTNFLAEQPAVAILPVAIAFAWAYLREGRWGALLAFAASVWAMAFLHLASLFFLVGSVGTTVLLLAAGRSGGWSLWRRGGVLALACASAAIPALPALAASGSFARNSHYLANLDGAFYKLSAGEVVAEFGVLVVALCAGGAVLLARRQGGAAWLGGLLFCAAVPLLGLTPLADALRTTPASPFLNLSHRAMYYLPLFVAVAGGLLVAEAGRWARQAVASIGAASGAASFGTRRRGAAAAVACAVVLAAPGLVFWQGVPRQEDAVDAFSGIDATRFGDLYEWIANSTGPGDVLMTNFVDLDQWIRYYAQRPTALSLSSEDIADPTFEERVVLYGRTFGPHRHPDLEGRLRDAGVDYVVVTRDALYVDGVTGAFVTADPLDDFHWQDYLDSFRRAGLDEAWSSPDAATYVFGVGP